MLWLRSCQRLQSIYGFGGYEKPLLKHVLYSRIEQFLYGWNNEVTPIPNFLRVSLSLINFRIPTKLDILLLCRYTQGQQRLVQFGLGMKPNWTWEADDLTEIIVRPIADSLLCQVRLPLNLRPRFSKSVGYGWAGWASQIIHDLVLNPCESIYIILRPLSGLYSRVLVNHQSKNMKI